MSAPITWAIRYTGNGADTEHPLYITDMPEAGSTGYGYCCPCRDTRRFASEAAATTFMDAKKLHGTHEPVDSIRGRKERDRRKASKPAMPEREQPKATAGWAVVT